ncbi:hypothetical protein BC830DRAFT_347929 [Chytriomyces sp. MP71]|nr:hypothetical protein BC830DRAFT_347929 [Chytriomyces sp. MP71]
MSLRDSNDDRSTEQSTRIRDDTSMSRASTLVNRLTFAELEALSVDIADLKNELPHNTPMRNGRGLGGRSRTADRRHGHGGRRLSVNGSESGDRASLSGGFGSQDDQGLVSFPSMVGDGKIGGDQVSSRNSANETSTSNNAHSFSFSNQLIPSFLFTQDSSQCQRQSRSQPQSRKASVSTPSGAASAFTTQLRFSPLASQPHLLSLAHALSAALTTLRHASALSPWDFADVVTNIDVAVHLHLTKDKFWARDVLQIGISLANAAVVGLTPHERRVADNVLGYLDGERDEVALVDPVSNGEIIFLRAVEESGVGDATETRVRALMDYFRVLAVVGPQSCYLTRKFLRALQERESMSLSMEDLAKKCCIEDRFWVRRRIVFT